MAFIVNTHNVICDALITQLTERKTIYSEVLDDFRLFFNMHMMDPKELNICIENISKKYHNDVDIYKFKNEVLHFLQYCKEINVINPLDMYKALIDGLQSTFPNVETILRIFLTIPISNASGERSFSVLKRVKNHLRNSISQPNLNNLSVIFIENEMVEDINFEEIIDKFASLKARKVNF